VFRPRVALDPYSIGIPGTYICSAATPPGAGAHGMCGYNAALSALRRIDPRRDHSDTTDIYSSEPAPGSVPLSRH
jgi:phytoene dehydrogenase-like protein